MEELLQTPGARLVLWLTALMILSIIGWYVVQRVRNGPEGPETSSEMLSKFSELRQSGELEDKEYRSIKTILAARMQAELTRDED